MEKEKRITLRNCHEQMKIFVYWVVFAFMVNYFGRGSVPITFILFL